MVICSGSHGPRGHVAIGVGNDVTDAHNMARFHQPGRVYIAINAIYQPYDNSVLPLVLMLKDQTNNQCYFCLMADRFGRFSSPTVFL